MMTALSLLAAGVSIEAVVMGVLYLLGAAAIFGLLFYAVNYCEKEFPSAAMFFRFIRIGLVVLACFVLIFVILGFMGHPVISWPAR